MNKSKKWLRLLIGLLLAVCVCACAGAEEILTEEETGSVTLRLFGSEAEVPYKLVCGEDEFASGTAATGMIVRVDDLPAGGYVLQIALPENMRTTQINGVPYVLEGDLYFSVPVKSGVVQPVEMVIAGQGIIRGTIAGVSDGVMAAVSDTDVRQEMIVTGGAFISEPLWPGSYEVSVLLPAGRYAGEGWTMVESIGGGVIARLECVLNGERELVLPGLSAIHEQWIAGCILDTNQMPVSGVQVTAIDEQGAQAASAVTDAEGAYRLSVAHPGSYTVHAAMEKTSDVKAAVSMDETVHVLLSAAKGDGVLEVTTFRDENNNSERDKYEECLSGVQIELLSVVNGTDMKVAEATVDAGGKAVFAHLTGGDYRIRATLPKDFGFSRKSEKKLRETSNVMELDSALTQTSQIIEINGDTVQTGVGCMPMSAVSGQVWLDASADGVRDPGEPGQPGILIEARGVKNGLTYQTVSDEDGFYYLGQLRPGSYVVTYTLPDGLMFTRYSASGHNNRSIITESNTNTGSKSFDLNKARVENEQNVGVQKEGTVEVRCFLDCNANGFYDEGDLPLPGVKCEVRKRSTNDVVDTQVSGEDGVVTFQRMRANTYKVRVVLPGQALFTKVTEGGNVFTAKNDKREATVNDIVLEASGEVKLQAGAVVLSSISGRVYMDDDFSGTMNGSEKPASGMVVELQNENGETLGTARTDKSGEYSFTKLNPGYYRLLIQAQEGYAFTRLGDGNVMTNRGGGQGSTDVFFLPMDTEMTGMDAGMIIPGTVTGTVFVDDNDNGIRDAGENGLTSVIVTLEDESGSVIFTANPREDGSFVFDAVMPGNYRVCYELPERGVFANGTTLDDSTKTEIFRMTSGNSVTVGEIGVLQLPEMNGLIFDDLNANGMRDAGEKPLSGVSVMLIPENSSHESVSDMSGEDGSFRIAGIRPGSYTLQISFPDGYVMSRVASLDIPVHPGAAQSVAELTVPSGAMWIEQTFGAVRPAALEGIVWLDTNNNGALDEEDAFPAGEQIVVWDMSMQSALITLTTDENGVFATQGIIPGEYRLIYTPDDNTVLAAGDHTFRKQEDGTFAMLSLNAVEGQTLSGASLGLMRYTTVGGNVWVDMGGQVSALANAHVTLMNEHSQELAASTSDESGAYQFRKLLPGRYILSVDLPEGYVVVEPGDIRLTEGGLVCVMAKCNRRHGNSDVFQVTMGAHMEAMDIGAVLPGRLGDVCWLDENGNGLYDAGLEYGIPNLTITLLKDGELVTETITDQYGFYCFKDLYPARYTMRVAMPDSMKPTTMRSDYPGIVSVLQENGETIPVEVESQSSNYNADMGFVLTHPNVFPLGYGEGAKQIWVKED